jgi:hypothetical protein
MPATRHSTIYQIVYRNPALIGRRQEHNYCNQPIAFNEHCQECLSAGFLSSLSFRFQGLFRVIIDCAGGYSEHCQECLSAGFLSSLCFGFQGLFRVIMIAPKVNSPAPM